MKKIIFYCIVHIAFGYIITHASTPDDTVITSNCLDIKAGEKSYAFDFSGDVKVTNQEFKLECNQLKVQTQADAHPSLTEPYGIGAIEQITALGNVRIQQGKREAQAGKAEVYPHEGKFILSENPVVIQEQGRLEGHKITWIRGDERIYIEGQPDSTTQRPKVVLPTPSGWADQPLNPQQTDEEPTTDAATPSHLNITSHPSVINPE